MSLQSLISIAQPENKAVATISTLSEKNTRRPEELDTLATTATVRGILLDMFTHQGKGGPSFLNVWKALSLLYVNAA